MADRVWGESSALLERAGLDLVELREAERELRESVGVLPGPIRDIHVHLGEDADGHRLRAADLATDLATWGVTACAVFPANQPGRDGCFTDANRSVLDAAREHEGLLVPFCRVDPTARWRAPLEAAAAAGARGLKLHPVAQRFALDDPEAIAAVAEASARGWPVVIHAGFGARPIAEALATMMDAVPDARLVLAHGARGDVRAVLERLGDHPGVWFDTSLAALTDLVALPVERLVFGSDRPYGEYGTALQLVGLAAGVAGWSDTELRGVLGANFAALVGAG